MRRRDRILQSAAAAALAVVPAMAWAGADPRLKPQLFNENLSLTNTENGGAGGIFAGPNVGTSATWVTPFFTVNNNSNLAGSWNEMRNWNPQVVPGGGGTATFAAIG